MARLPDINIQSWIEDQQEQFKQSTSGLFDALNFDLGAREMASSIPPDYDALGGMDQWQQVEQQRIKDELDRQQREEEERRQQQAALEEQQRQQAEAERQQAAEAQAMSWSKQLGIPTPDEIGEHLQGVWNRPADNIGTTGALPQATPDADAALMRPLGGLAERFSSPGRMLEQTPFAPAVSGSQTPMQDFLNWSGNLASGAIEAVPEAARQATEAYQEYQRTPLGMAGGMPAAIGGASEISNALVGPIAEQAYEKSNTFNPEEGSFVNVPIPEVARNAPVVGQYLPERFAPSERQAAVAITQGILDPTNLLLEEGPMTRALGSGARTAAELAAEGTASAIRRAQGDTGRGMLRRGAERALDQAETWARGGRELPGQRVIPADVVDELDIPIVLPTDPNALDAIRRAGGTVDDRGVTVHTVRMQDEAGEGQLQTRGGVFALAGPPGMRSFYEGAEGAQTGGQNRIEGWTRFRNPLILYEAPGTDINQGGGFQEAVRKLGIRPQEGFPASPQQIEDDIGRSIRAARQAGPPGSPERAAVLKETIARYGGEPETVDEMLRIRGENEESAWSVRENIVAHNARRQGHDGVLAIEPTYDSSMSQAIDEAIEKIPEYAALKSQVDAQWQHYDMLEQQANQILESHGVHSPEHQEAFQVLQDSYDAAGKLQRQLDNMHDRLVNTVEIQQPHQIKELADYREGLNPTPGPMIDNPRRAELQQEITRLRELYQQRDQELGALHQGRNYWDMPDAERGQSDMLTAYVADLRDQIYRFEDELRNTPVRIRETVLNPEHVVARQRVEQAEQAYEQARQAYSRLKTQDARDAVRAARMELDYARQGLLNTEEYLPVGRPGFGIRPDIPRRVPGERFPEELEGPLPRRGEAAPPSGEMEPNPFEGIEFADVEIPPDALEGLKVMLDDLAKLKDPEDLPFLTDEAIKLEQHLRTRTGLGLMDVLAHPDVIAGLQGAVAAPIGAGDFADDDRSPVERLRDIALHAGLGAAAGVAARRGARRLTRQAPTVLSRATEEEIQAAGRAARAAPEGFRAMQPNDPVVAKLLAIRQMKAAGLSSEAAERELATSSRMTLDEIRDLTAHAPLEAQQATRAGTDVAEASVPRQPPPPNAKPAKPKGSTRKTMDIGAPDAPAPKGPPIKAGEEVMVPKPEGEQGVDIGRVRSYDPRTDSVTILTEDGTAIRAKSADLERHGVATTRTSPHPGFSTGEADPIPENPGGVGGGGGRKPPAPPAGPSPTPPPTPPGRPAVGPGSVVDEQRLKIRQKNEDIAKGRIKTGPPTPEDIGRLQRWITNIRQKLTDRRAPLEALEKHLESIQGKPLTPTQKAHLAARIYEGHSDAAKARLERGLAPAYDGMTEEEFKWLNDVWEQLDEVDKTEAVRLRAQQESLGKPLPEAKTPKEDARRIAEAELEERRSRTQLRAAEKEVMAAQKEREVLLADMERLGIDVERRPSPEPGKRRVKRETQKLETPEVSAAHDRWTKNVIRNEKAQARLQDLREHEEHARQWAQERIDRNRAISAERHAENVVAARKHPSGALPQEKEAILANMKAQIGTESYNKVRKALDASLAMRDEMRALAVNSGIWTPEIAQDLMARFPHYTPTKLLEHMQEMDNAAVGGKTFSTHGNLINKLSETGSEGARKPAVQSLIEMVYQYQEAASRNTVMNRVASWADHPDMRSFIKKLREGEDPPQGFEAMSARVNGEIQRLAVIKPYADALKLGSPFQDGAGGKILRGFSAPLRMGATAGRPAFIVTNAVHDAMTTLFRFITTSKDPIEAARSVTDLLAGYRATFGMAGYGTRAAVGGIVGAGAEATREAREAYAGEEGSFSPTRIAAAGLVGAGLGLGVRATAADRAAMQAMREAGGSIGQRGRWGKDTIPTLISELRGQKRLIRVAQNEGDLKGFLNWDNRGQWRDFAGLFWTRPLENVGQIVETAPRLAAFRRAQRQGMGLEESANAARRITADFAAGGAWTKNVNTLIPFLNASTQGAVEDLLSIRNNPVKAAAALAVIVPTVMAAEIWNMTVAPDDYQDVSRYTQDHGLVLLSPDAPEGEGKRGLLFIPTRGMLGSILALTKNVMHAYIGDDPRSWQKLAGDTAITAIQNLSPISPDVTSTLQSFTPPMAGTALELAANYDFFRRQPIVSRSMETLPVTEQYDDRTSQLARRLSRTNLPWVGGSSPMKIDWALRSISPGPGEAVLGAADLAIRHTVGDLPTSTSRDVPRGARDVPVVGTISGRFLRTVGSERQNQAYEAADEIAARNRPDMVAYLERSPEYQRATPDRQRQMLRSMETALLEQSREQAGVYEFERPKDVGLPERYYGVPSGSRLEAEIASAFAASAKTRTPQQQILIAQYRSRQNPFYTRAARQQRREMAELREYVETSRAR